MGYMFCGLSRGIIYLRSVGYYVAIVFNASIKDGAEESYEQGDITTTKKDEIVKPFDALRHFMNPTYL